MHEEENNGCVAKLQFFAMQHHNDDIIPDALCLRWTSGSVLLRVRCIGMEQPDLRKPTRQIKSEPEGAF